MICDLRVVDIPMPFLSQARLLARKNSHLEVLQGLLRVRVIDDNIEDFLREHGWLSEELRSDPMRQFFSVTPGGPIHHAEIIL